MYSQSLGFTGLFAVTTQAEYESLVNFLTDYSMDTFGSVDMVEFHINGQQKDDGKWYFIESTTPIYPGIESSLTTGGCLNIMGSFSELIVKGEDCNRALWYVVEFPIETSQTSPQTTTPNAESLCADIVTITDSTNTATKKVCLIPLDLNPDQAQAYAVDKGFAGLFKITNQEDLIGLTGLYYSGAEFVISGFQNVDGVWVYTGSNTPINSDTIPTSSTDKCLSVTDSGVSGVFKIVTRSCDYENWFLVEIPISQTSSSSTEKPVTESKFYSSDIY